MWSLYLPLIQPCSPASLATRTLRAVLGTRIADYTYVDFAAGAGGPTPFFEADLNTRLGDRHAGPVDASGYSNDARSSDQVAKKHRPIDFVLTDIAPHVPAWTTAAERSRHLHYIPRPIDAANAPPNLLDDLVLPDDSKRKVFRLFSLAFHHFPDPLAAAILANSLETSSGFAIFELQTRTVSSFILITLMGPLLLLVTPICFWTDPIHLIFTYLVPIVPFIVVFDGYISSLRTRTGEEIKEMIVALDKDATKDWEFRWGSEWHTRPLGEMTWFIGIKKPRSDAVQ